MIFGSPTPSSGNTLPSTFGPNRTVCLLSATLFGFRLSAEAPRRAYRGPTGLSKDWTSVVGLTLSKGETGLLGRVLPVLVRTPAYWYRRGLVRDLDRRTPFRAPERHVVDREHIVPTTVRDPSPPTSPDSTGTTRHAACHPGRTRGVRPRLGTRTSKTPHSHVTSRSRHCQCDRERQTQCVSVGDSRAVSPQAPLLPRNGNRPQSRVTDSPTRGTQATTARTRGS